MVYNESMSRTIDLHARGYRQAFLEGLFWLFVLMAIALLVAGLWSGWFVFALLGAVGLLVLMYGGFVEPRLVQITNYSLGEGEKRLRIVFLSDFHAGVRKQQDFYQYVAQKTAEQKPDLILLGGDFVDECVDDLGGMAPIAKLQAPLGVWSVLGNHDFFDNPQKLASDLAGQGVRDLTNKAKSFKLTEEASLEVIGLDDSCYGSPDLSLIEKPKAGLRLIVTHEPDVLVDLPAGCADLILLGHTHGGQIRLPIRGPVLGLPQVISQSLDMGEKTWNGLRVIISRGIGESLVRARLGARPEIVVLDVLAR